MDARLDAMDKATALLSEKVTCAPEIADREGAYLKNILEKRLEDIQHRLDIYHSEMLSCVAAATDKAQLARDALRDLFSSQLSALTDVTKVQFDAGQVSFTKLEAAAVAVDVKAQTANDTLERLVEANHAAAIELTNFQFNASREAITKSEAASAVAAGMFDVRINGQFDTLAKQFHAALDALERQVDAARNTGRQRTMEHTVAVRVSLEAALDASNKMTSSRFDSAQQALAKVDSQLALSATAAQAAVTAVDSRSTLRYDAVTAMVHSSEEKMINRVTSLQQMIDLRSEMSQTAIIKAEQANDQRLAAVNEFRETLTDQARSFVTSSVMDARISQIQLQLDTIERTSRSSTDGITAAISTLNSQIAAISSRLAVGAGGIAVLFLAIQLVLNLVRHGAS